MLDIFWLLVSELKLKHVISWHYQTAENTTHHSHGSNHINSGCSRHRKSSHTRLLLFLLAVCGNRTGDGSYRGLYVTNPVLWSCTWALVPPQKTSCTIWSFENAFHIFRAEACLIPDCFLYEIYISKNASNKRPLLRFYFIFYFL